MSNLLIVSVLVLVTGFLAADGPKPSWLLQPATTRARTGRDHQPRRFQMLIVANALPDDRRFNPVTDSLRVIGLIRKRVDRPVVGKKAYVRWWERVRAAMALTAIVIALGIALATAIGVVILGAGFLLEQAIS